MTRQESRHEHSARAGFSRARQKAFWQGIRSALAGKSDTLLPYDQVRQAIQIQGQRYRGLHAIPIKQIVGSVGRYHEFNRAFLPIQRHTENRWVNISRAIRQNVPLPPIEVYKLGEVYFVKDGNHRVSAGKELGRDFIDAFVTEVDIPVSLTPDTDVSELETMRETAEFIERTGLRRMFPDSKIELSLKGEVARLLQHIDTHRYYLGIIAGQEPEYEEAVRSWYTQVYTPLLEEIHQFKLDVRFPALKDTDLYLLISEYQWLLREAYQNEADLRDIARTFGETLAKISPEAAEPVKKAGRALRNAPWLDDFILKQERREFISQTQLELEVSVPGAYSRLLQHIHDHRWYLGIDRQRSIDWAEAVESWHENIYLPLAVLVREMDILSRFPGRTEADLYLWIIEHQSELSETLNWEVPAEIAAANLVQSARPNGKDDRRPEPDRSGPTMLPSRLFANILVPIGDRPEDLVALDQALVVAERNRGRVFGLHVISSLDEVQAEHHDELAATFEQRCAARGVPGKIAFDTGSIARRIAARAAWMDLIVLNLNFPPSSDWLVKLASGFRYLLRRCGRPMLAVPQAAGEMRRLLLAYDGSPLADEALYIASSLMAFWEDCTLNVVTAGGARAAEAIQIRARVFLESHSLAAGYHVRPEPAHQAILSAAEQTGSELILMGGYGNPPLVEIALGSTLDGVLQGSRLPILICA